MNERRKKIVETHTYRGTQTLHTYAQTGPAVVLNNGEKGLTLAVHLYTLGKQSIRFICAYFVFAGVCCCSFLSISLIFRVTAVRVLPIVLLTKFFFKIALDVVALRCRFLRRRWRWRLLTVSRRKKYISAHNVNACVCVCV